MAEKKKELVSLTFIQEIGGTTKTEYDTKKHGFRIVVEQLQSPGTSWGGMHAIEQQPKLVRGLWVDKADVWLSEISGMHFHNALIRVPEKEAVALDGRADVDVLLVFRLTGKVRPQR